MIFMLAEQGSFTIPDEWWIEAGMSGFRPTSPAYRAAPDPNVVFVAVKDVARPLRSVEKDFGGFERVRLIKIFTGFVAGQPLPPVKVHEPPQGPFRYELRDGFHRFYASVAAGYDRIPASLATYLPFDVNMLSAKPPRF